MSETPRTDAVPSEESRIKRLREWARRALLREPGASIIERTIAEDVQHLEAKYQRDLAAERERADRLIAFLADDALAMTYQSLAQYRQAAIDSARRK